MKLRKSQKRWQGRLLGVALILATLLMPGPAWSQALVVDLGLFWPFPPNFPIPPNIFMWATEDVGVLVGGTIIHTSTGWNPVGTYLSLGSAPGVTGTYSLSDPLSVGSLLTAPDEYVGNSGIGIFNQFNANTLNWVTSDLYLGYWSTGVGTYNLNDGTLLVSNDEHVGYWGTGTFNQSGGTNTVTNWLFLGFFTGSNGTYNLSGGSLSAANESVGDGPGQGTFNQSGGTNTVTNTLYVGRYSSGVGTYNLSGTGSLSAADEYIGYGGTGTFTQSGGTNTVTGTLTLGIGYIGPSSYGKGYYYLWGGSLSAANEVIGDNGLGQFYQYMGTNAVSGTLTLGKQSTGRGYYFLYGGVLDPVDEIIGDAGTGSFYQYGGINTVTGTLTLGKQTTGVGYYFLYGGDLQANNETVGDAGTGSFYQYGGINTATGTLTLGKASTGVGYYTLYGGILTAGNEIIGDYGTGSFYQHGGAHTVTDTLTLGKSYTDSTHYGIGYYYLLYELGATLTAGYERIGDAGTGYFYQYGGTNTVTEVLYLGRQSTGVGYYELHAGVLNAGAEIIGDAGTGTFTQSGGTHTVTESLTLGYFSIGSGTYNLSGGSLHATNEYIGYIGTGIFNQSGGTNTVTGALYLGYFSGSHGTYNLIDGVLDPPNEFIGYGGTGIFEQTGGTNTANNLYLGYTYTDPTHYGVGTYNLRGGSLHAVNEFVGYSGTGTFNQYGVTNTVTGSLYLGYTATGVGTYNLNDGVLDPVNEYIGYSGTGTFEQTGGTNTVTNNLYLGYNATGVGTYNLRGGSLSVVASEFVGYSGTGTFTQTGGTNTVSFPNVVGNDLYLGYFSGSHGTYNLFGGSLSCGRIENIGYYGTGEFTQRGGTNTVAVGLNLGTQASGVGTYNLDDGTLAALGNEVIGYYGTGTFNQRGGTNTVTGNLYLGLAYTDPTHYGIGYYYLYGGVLDPTNEYIGYAGHGTFTQSGGTNTVTNNLYLGYEATGVGTYNLSGTGSLQATNEYIGYSGTGTFTQSGIAYNTVTNNLYLGFNSTGVGTYTLNGGWLTVQNNEYIGYSGTGTFTQSGGSNLVWYDLYLGYNANSHGTYNLSGGRLETSYDSVYVGYAGTGEFNQSGGYHFPGVLYLGGGPPDNFTTGVGTYNLSGTGYLGAIAEFVGYSGTGEFNQSAGTNIASNLFLGYTGGATPGVGTYNLSDGYLQAAIEFIGYYGTGTFTQTGGINDVGIMEVPLLGGGTGFYDLQGGTLYAGTIDLNPGGTFNQELASTLNANYFNQYGGTVTGSLENYVFGTFNYFSGDFLGSLRNWGTVNLGPGRSTGTTLDILNDYTHYDSGLLNIKIFSESDYDRINVGGSAILDENGLVQPLLQNGYLPRGNTDFQIITAFNDLTPGYNLLIPYVFSQAVHNRVDNSLTLFWSPENTYPNTFDLVVRRDYTNVYLNLNYKQHEVGTMLNSVALAIPFSDLDNVLNVIDYLPTYSAVGDAYKQISPEKAQALADLSFMGAKLQTQTLSRRITNLRYCLEDLGGAGGLSGAYNLDSRGGGLMLAYNSSDVSGLITAKRENPETRWGLYLDPAGFLGSRSTTMDRTGYDFSGEGFTAGIDYRVQDNLLLGLATGFTHANADFNGSGGKAEANTWPISLYTAYLPGSFYAFGTVGYALNLYNLDRQIRFSSPYNLTPFNSVSRTASSSPTGHQFNAYGEAGYDLKLKPVVVTPMLSLGYSHLWIGGFTETGADSLNLNVSKQNVDSFQTGVGAKVAVPFKVGEAKVVPQVYASWQHEFANDKRGLDARLAQGSSSFTWMTEKPRRDFAKVGGSATVFVKKNLSAHVNYNAEVGGGSTTHFINAGLRWQF